MRDAKNRTRKNDIRLMLSDNELRVVEKNMKKIGIKNRSLFARKMITDGYILDLEIVSIKELLRLVRNATNNINQVAKRANETGCVYEDDVLDLVSEVGYLTMLVTKAQKTITEINNR